MDHLLLAVTAILLFLLVLSCLLPLNVDSVEDLGDGRTHVRIPKFVKTSVYRPRTWTFLTVAAVLGIVFLGWQRPSLPALWIDGVRGVASAISRDPASVNGYVARLRPATQYFALSYIIGLAVVIRGTWGRRLAVLWHAALYLAMSLLLDALMVVIGISTGWLVSPFGIEATLANLLVGGLVVMRLTFTTFVMPRATTVPGGPNRRAWDTILTWCALVVVVAAVFVVYAFIAEPGRATSVWQVFVPLYAVSILFVLISAPLWLLWWTSRRLPKPDGNRPPVDIIVPAYNEAENIARLLKSIEIAAERYGGPVHVVVSNDGSGDDTEAIAWEEIFQFQHASGRVLTAPNGGQAAALNRGLAVTRSEIVIRIDADCVMGPDALVYSIPWFRDAGIGSVGAMEEPRTDTVTWFHRLRVLETTFQFRFARLGQSVVDGIVVIPGTFTAFRRGPAIIAGGFPQGMNGEDCDLTMQIGRLGYRTVVDPRIRSYEDVPRSAGEFVEQRTRWARAGFHTFARHESLRAGSFGPRVWFWTIRRGFAWFSLQVGMVAPIFMLELVLTHPSYRQNVITFFLLYMLAGALPLIVSLPFVVRYGYWRSLPWIPTWFAFAFLRRMATLEAVISLPTRPLVLPASEWLRRTPDEPAEAADERAPVTAG